MNQRESAPEAFRDRRHLQRRRRMGTAIAVVAVLALAALVASALVDDGKATDTSPLLPDRGHGPLAASCQPFESVVVRVLRGSVPGITAVRPVRSRHMTAGAFLSARKPPPQLEGPIIEDLAVCAFILRGLRDGRAVTAIVETPADGKTKPPNFYTHVVDVSDEPEWWSTAVPG